MLECLHPCSEAVKLSTITRKSKPIATFRLWWFRAAIVATTAFSAAECDGNRQQGDSNISNVYIISFAVNFITNCSQFFLIIAAIVGVWIVAATVGIIYCRECHRKHMS